MNDQKKTKRQLLEELMALRMRLVQLERASAGQEALDSLLKESEVRYRDVIETIPEPYAEVDLAGNVQFFNEAFLKDMGYSREQMQGLNYRTYMDRKNAGYAFTIYNHVFKTGTPIKSREMEWLTKSGEKRQSEVSISLIRDSKGEPSGFRSLYHDVTERRKMEEALKKSEALLRAVFDSVQDFIFIKDPNGRYILTNNFFLNKFKIDVTSDIGKTDRETNLLEYQEKPLTVVEETDRQVLHGETVEYVITHRIVGNEITLHVIKAPIRDENGLITGICGIGRDISERRILEEDLIRSRKLESVGTLAGGIAHDFNNLLAAIEGYIEMVKDDIPPENRAYNRLLAAERATMQAAELTGRLITFAGGGTPVKSLCDLGELVKDTVLRGIGTTPLKKKFFISPDLCSAEVDEGQMRQVLRSLSVNAVEAMPDGGTLTVRVNNVMVDSSNRLPIPKGPYVHIAIEDTGTGIAADDLPQIFDPYYSTKQRGPQKGMGLGLSVCYSVVNRHHGYINAESTEGQGSTFHVYLPAIADGTSAGTSMPQGIKKASPKKILIMDDEAMVRNMAKELLSLKGYYVETAADGLEAIGLYIKAKEAHEPFDAVILDLTIKGGMGGVTTMERLLAIDHEVKAIILSGYTDDPVIRNYDYYGFAGAVTKPFTSKVLQAALEKICTG